MALDAGSVIAKMDLALEGWKKSVETVKKDQQSLAGFALRHKQEIQDLGKAFTIAGGAIVASLGAAVKVTADYGDKINDLSQRTGVATEILSGYKLAADNSGTSIDGLATGFKFLSQRMVDIQAGGKDSIELFKVLGVEVLNADGTLRDSNDVMLDVAERFKGMEDGAGKTALAVEVFGRSGMELIPFLNLGRDGLRENYENAERFGTIVSKQAAKAADEFNDSLGNMKSALSGAGMQLGQVLMPIVQGAIEQITDIVVKVREWADEHPQLFKAITTIVGAVGALMLAAGPLLIALPSLIKGFEGFKTTLHGFNPLAMAGATAIGILVTKILEYKEILDDLKGQYEKNIEIDKNWSDAQDRSALVLANAAREAGWLRGRMQELIEAYDGNLAALQSDIREGKHGIEIKNSLAGAGDRVNEMLKRQKGAFDGLKPTIETTTTAHGKLNDSVKKIIELIPTAVGKIRDIQIPIVELGETAIITTRDTDALWEKLKNSPKPRIDTEDFKKDRKDLNDGFQDTTDEMKQAWANMVTDIAQGWSAAVVDILGITESLVGESTKHNQEYFDGALSDLEATYEAQKAYIEETVTDKDAQVQALAELDAWYAGEKERITGDMERSEKEHAENAEKRANSLWTKMKDVFGKAVEGMLTAWLTKLISPLLDSITNSLFPKIKDIGKESESAATAAGGSFSTLGQKIADVAKGIGDAIKEIAGAIIEIIELIAKTVVDIVAYALETLASSIAAAAKSLAAAAPELLIVGGIALALYAGFQAINALLGSGGGGSGDGMGRVVERQDRFLAVWDWWAPDMAAIASFIQGQNDHRADQLDTMNGTIHQWGAEIRDAVFQVRDAISSISGAAEGALVTSPSLMMVGEDAPRVPEVILPLPEVGAFARSMGMGAAAGGPVTVQLNGPLIHTTGVSRSDLERAAEDLVSIIERQVGRLAHA
ncbi:MAG: phage tail tape measure protein [Candidatus Omnitrophota bacterium]|jgi:hypothetical protein